MPAGYGQPSGDWRNRLPGSPGAAQAPSWSTPEGLYQYIMAQVPGISPEAAAWMHGQILGGHPFLQGPFLNPGSPVRGVVNPGASGYPSSPATGAEMLTYQQMRDINALMPFSGNAPTFQIPVPGDPVVKPPPVGPQPRPNTGEPTPPEGTLPPESGNMGVTPRPINRPPGEDVNWYPDPVLAVPTPPRSAAMYPPAGGIDWWDTGAGLAGRNAAIDASYAD